MMVYLGTLNSHLHEVRLSVTVRGACHTYRHGGVGVLQRACLAVRIKLSLPYARTRVGHFSKVIEWSRTWPEVPKNCHDDTSFPSLSLPPLRHQQPDRVP